MARPRLEARALADAAVESVLLFGAWLLFVSKLAPHELWLGAACALLGAAADGVVKAQDLAVFSHPRRSLMLAAWTPWYALTGTWSNLRALGERLAGRPSSAAFRELPLDAAGEDSGAAARRALAETVLSIPPNSIVLAVDPEEGRVLIHQIRPAPPSRLARRLGAGP